ncbi:MAG: trigger factor [Bacillota bacterium]|nr:trigger factor [Bacillota bacterium]
MSQIIKLGNYKGVEYDIEMAPVTELEIQAELDAIVAQNPIVEEVEGPVEEGHTTTIDFEGFKDGVPFDGGKGEGFDLTIGSGQFIPGFESQMVGMVKGETRDLNVTFPEQYQAAELAGQPVVFKVTVHKITKKTPATLNDEFVKSFDAPDIQTVDALKERIEQQLKLKHSQEDLMKIEDMIFDQIIADSEVKLEEADVKTSLEQHVNHMRAQLAQSGMMLEQYLQMMGATMEQLEEQLRPTAEKQAKFQAIIDEIIKLEGIASSDEEVEQQIKLIAQSNGVSEEMVKAQINVEDLKNDFARYKASRFVVDSAKDKKVA